MQALTLHAKPGLSMSMSPVSFHLTAPDHAQNFAGHVTVTDSGTQPVIVHPSTLRLGAKVTCTQHAVPWLHVNIATFKLEPGQSHTLAFTVDYVPGLTGNAAVMAYGQGPSSHGTVSAWVGTGARVVVGSGAQQCTKPVSAPAVHSSGLSGDQVIGLAILAVLVVCIGVLIIRTRVRRSS